MSHPRKLARSIKTKSSFIKNNEIKNNEKFYNNIVRDMGAKDAILYLKNLNDNKRKLNIKLIDMLNNLSLTINVKFNRLVTLVTLFNLTLLVSLVYLYGV